MREVGAVLFAVWLIANSTGLFVGVLEAQRAPLWRDCRLTRASYVFPGFQLGCWLGEPLE